LFEYENMPKRIPPYVGIVVEFVASIFISAAVFFVSSFVFFLNGFESFILGITIFVAWRIIAIWLRHEKSLTSLEASSKEQASLRVRKGKIKSELLDIFFNFEEVSQEYTADHFIVKLYETKIDNINTDLASIRDGEWVKIETNIFRRYPKIIFNIPKDDDNSYFYATASCGEGTKWFSTGEGASYLKNIHMKIKKKNIKRLFIYDSDNPITKHDEICFQLHKNNDYEIKKIERDVIDDIFAGIHDLDILNDFGIYGKNFVWEKMPNSNILKRGNLSIDPQKISAYTDAFNKAWEESQPIQIDDENIIHHCEGIKRFDKLRDLITVWDREHPNCPPTQTATPSTHKTGIFKKILRKLSRQ